MTFALSSCASMTPAAAKRAYCNMLKSRMVFSGSTGITREANIQNSEEPREQIDYDQEDCDDVH
jgi:hypothetical protein